MLPCRPVVEAAGRPGSAPEMTRLVALSATGPERVAIFPKTSAGMSTAEDGRAIRACDVGTSRFDGFLKLDTSRASPMNSSSPSKLGDPNSP